MPLHTPTRPRLRRALSQNILLGIVASLAATSSVQAQATWVGDTSNDWNNASNWSSDPSSPSGNFTVNLSTGNFPILSADSAFTPVDVFIASGANTSGRFDHRAGFLTQTNTSTTGVWYFVGKSANTANGTYNLADTSSTDAGISGFAQGTGSLTVGKLWVGGAPWNVGGTGTVNINTTGIITANSTQDFGGGNASKAAFSLAYGSGSSGTVNMQNGTINANSEMWVGFSGTAAFNQSGGTVNTTESLVIGRNSGANATYNLTGGVVNAATVSGQVLLGANAGGVGTVNLDGGTLQAPVVTKGGGTGTFNFNGGVLRAGATSATFFGGLTNAYVKAGGAIIDSNGFDITVSQALLADTVSTGGGLTKNGAGTLTLSGANTYVGNTTVDAGTLALADNASLKFVIGATGVNNQVTGSGGFTVDGDFAFDLAAAGTTLGDSWQIVDVSTLAETFGGTFTVTGFTANAGKWTRPANGAFYQFDPATGVLQVVNDPDYVFPAPSATPGNYNTTYAIGSDIVLSVSGSGLGELTYQWYYQADVGATPVAITDATASTLTVPAATSSSGGIYSVIVTDHAPEASGKPATTTTAVFSAISVVPASDLAVAYYRFEEGSNGDAIASALDSVGGNNLSPLGAPSYTGASVPFATIPATGASNTLASNFPASGNNGLVAPIVGTLAETAFTDFTVEAFVRFSDANGVHTIVGRDDTANTGEGTGSQSLFYLQRNGGKLRVEVITKDNTNVQVNSDSTPALNTWYHVAAVGNAGAGTLKLYVNGVQVGAATGFTGLFVPSPGSNTPWTVGRGEWAGNDADFLRGDIDEVRITRAALAPSQFLNSSGGVAVVPPTLSVAPTYASVLPGADVLLTATATSNMGGTITYQWYKDGSPLGDQTAANLSLTSVTLGADGVYSVVVTDSSGGSGATPITASATSRLRVLDLPAAGARAIGLNFVGAASSPEPWAVAWSHVLGTMDPATSAGVYPAANWNNSAAVADVYLQTTPLALRESDGSTTSGASATWSAAGTWSARVGTGDPSVKTPDALLLHGYVESRAAAGSSVTVSNIPYASYDVYVHVAGGTNGAVGSLKINREASPTYYYRVFQHDAYEANPYAVPLAMGESLTRTEALSAPPATFVRFAGVTGSDLTITAADSVLNQNSGGIAAIQIVDRTPAGTAYPLVVTSAPVSKLARGGANVSFGVTAVSQNSGTLAYQWQKDGADLSGQTGATLSLNNVTGSSSGNYGVTVTETSALGTITTTRTASLVVVDGTRSLLINGDINTATSPTFSGHGILRADGSSTVADLGTGATVWNGILGASGAATRILGLESTGLSLPSVSFSYADAGGVEDNATAGGIASSSAVNLSRDYLYTDNQTTPLTATVGGLQALAGRQVTLVVYAYGKLSTAFWENGYPGQVPTGSEPATLGTSDTATVTLATANNHLVSAPAATTTIADGGAQDAGRKIEDNNLENTGGTSAAYVTFTGVVAPDGTVSWNLGPDSDAGRIPLVGFQLLVTGIDIAPPVPAGLSATAGTGQVSLSWTASTGAVTYTIKRSTSIAGPYAPISQGVTTVTSYTDNDVIGGTTYYYTVAAANSLAQSPDSEPVSATPASNLSALQNWRQTHFGTTANEGNAANTADFDQDGASNLLEYALGTDPTSAGAVPVSVARAGNVLTLGFSHSGDPTLLYKIEASNDLASWSTAYTFPAFNSPGNETYTDTVPLDSQTRRFLRLIVTAP